MKTKCTFPAKTPLPPKTNENPNTNGLGSSIGDKRREALAWGALAPTAHTQGSTHSFFPATFFPRHAMAPAMSKAIVVYDQLRPVYIYIVTDKRTNRVIYVGQSVDVSRRWKQHAKATTKCSKLKQRIAEGADMLEFGVVSELPRGVPSNRADEFETYFMDLYDTIHHSSRRPDGCNLHKPPNSADVDHEALRAELEKGFEWPDAEVNEAVPDDVAQAAAQEAMLADLVSIAEDEVPESLSKALTVATMERMQLERQCMGALEFAKDLRDEYADNYDDAINRNDFAVHLNLLNEKITDDGEDEVISGVVNAVLLAAKPQRNVEMSSKAAAMFLGGIYEMLYARDDARRLAKLEWTLRTNNMGPGGKKDDPVVKDHILAVRKWSRTHDDAKPVMTSVDPEEARHGYFLNGWKRNDDRYGGAMTDLASCRVVMRDLPWFDEFVDFKKAGTEVLDTLITQLVGGAALDKEPEFGEVETRTPLSSGKDNLKVYEKYRSMLIGIGSEADVTKVVNALEANGQPKRAAWLRKTYGEARPAALEKVKEAAEKRRNTKREAADDTAQGSSSKKAKTDEVN